MTSFTISDVPAAILLGTISTTKLGGYSIILGPIIALIFWLIATGGPFIDTVDLADAMASIQAAAGNSMSTVSNFLVTIGLLMLLNGIVSLQTTFAGKGNGITSSNYGVQLVRIGLIGIVVVAIALGNVVAGFDLARLADPASATVASGSITGVYAAATGINITAGGILSLGFLLFSLGLSTRDDQNKIFCLIVAVASVVGVIAAVISGTDSSQLQTMNNVTGVVYLISTIWVITLGLKMIK